jgi:serine kinase of HPr protein (carbohydrate metabolism regulator)
MFLIQEGRSIIVSPLEEYKEDVIRLYILGSCMGAILMQKRILPLHGSAVAIDGKAFAIIGESGAGKSTLASAFISRGFQF